nr:fluoride efflux transporter CrcB [Streptococcus massiliensis]
MVLYLMTACGLGTLIRFVFSQLNSRYALPLGTLVANILGAFLIGIFYKSVADKQVYAILATGFCGGLTTFSTLNAELLALLENKKKFLSYLLLTYLLGFLAIFLGILL